MCFFVENWIPVSKLGWETRHTVKFGLFGGPLFTWDFPIIGSIVKKFWAPEKIRPARHFLWRKPKKTLPRPFIDVIFCGELDSGVEIGVWNPAHGQIWAFWGTTFQWRFSIFSNIGSIVKKISFLGKNPSRQAFFMKEAEKTLPRPFIDVIFRGESDSGVETGVRNPAHGQIWAFLGTTIHLRFFQHRVNF